MTLLRLSAELVRLTSLENSTQLPLLLPILVLQNRSLGKEVRASTRLWILDWLLTVTLLDSLVPIPPSLKRKASTYAIVSCITGFGAVRIEVRGLHG